jgi:hypothetical protein
VIELGGRMKNEKHAMKNAKREEGDPLFISRFSLHVFHFSFP